MEENAVVLVGAVDDHPVVLAGLKTVIEEAAPEVRLVAFAPTVEELLAERDDLDVVLLDLRLGDASTPGTNTGRLLAAGSQVVVYTDGAKPAQVYSAVARGALGVVLKDEPLAVLVEAVRAAHRGEAVVSVRMARALETAPHLDDLLSPQERQVLRLYAADLPAKSVARRLGIGEGTVKEYLKRIRSKLAAVDVRASSKLELRNVAETMGLLDDDDASSGAAQSR
ncbi:response regulator transcription factor [Streptomyces sp. NP160]|uniref:LuxR C-terminal-related transcriptional regulator n=1 Tax=Streptomyces sp. NP160 TaxID=2586637 RepID=UPI001119C651|nr:response regulator transcription factor [Streptomyces sp. NP160]TNM59497.1 response regulator transcription factor [Streptomyces sp. NP160]